MEEEMKNKADDATRANEGPGRDAIKRPTEARIPLMDVSALSQDQRALASIGASNVLRMLAHRGDCPARSLMRQRVSPCPSQRGR